MKGEIQDYLRAENNWKKFVIDDEFELRYSRLVNIDVVTIQEERQRVYFDVSIVYRHIDGKQMLTYESGVITIDDKGKIVTMTDRVA